LNQWGKQLQVKFQLSNFNYRKESVMKRRLIALAALSFGAVLFLQTVSANQGGDSNARGRKLYQRYCASCHGLDGKGGGPVAASLKTAIPDLTNIPKVDGKFPSLRILQSISGELPIAAHGDREMPVWGTVFRRREGPSKAQLDVYALTKYVESIQSK
jgi:mono/diheme cytochrome c family protein